MSKDGGQVFHVQNAAVQVIVLDYAPDNIAVVDTPVILATDTSQDNAVYASFFPELLVFWFCSLLALCVLLEGSQDE